MAKFEVCPIEYPGRGRRISEDPYTVLSPMVESLADVLLVDKPYAFVGHSMGALVAFELARELRKKGRALPFSIIPLAARAPHLRPKPPIRHVLSDSALVEEIRELGGTPEAVLNDRSLMQLVLSRVRADFSVLETHVSRDEPPLSCSIFALMGTNDPIVDKAEVLAWAEHTTSFAWHAFASDHFFPHRPLVPVMDRVGAFLNATMRKLG